MIAKTLAVISFVVLPFSATLWHRSHRNPQQYRFDVTVYKSLRVYLKDGVCGMRLLSLPTKTNARSEFRAPLRFAATPKNRALLLSSSRQGLYRITWFVFPLWLSTLLLTVVAFVPVARGPIRRTWRRMYGRCLECGYDLRGCHRGRCSECGTRFC